MDILFIFIVSMKSSVFERQCTFLLLGHFEALNSAVILQGSYANSHVRYLQFPK